MRAGVHSSTISSTGPAPVARGTLAQPCCRPRWKSVKVISSAIWSRVNPSHLPCKNLASLAWEGLPFTGQQRRERACGGNYACPAGPQAQLELREVSCFGNL